MKNYGIYTVWTKCWEGLTGGPDGYSIKKMIAALYATVGAVLLFIYTNTNNFLAVLPIILGFITSLIVIRAVEKNNVLKSEAKEETEVK